MKRGLIVLIACSTLIFLSFVFAVTEVPKFIEISHSVVNVSSPVNNEIYNYNKIAISIISQTLMAEIEYIDFSDSNPKWKTLCTWCTHVSEFKSFKQGEHEVWFGFRQEDGSENYTSLKFLVDNKNPKIIRTSPKANSFTNGENFYIKYSEESLKKISLTVADEKTELPECNISGIEQECYFSFDLAENNGYMIDYSFEIEDLFGNIEETKKMKIKVDTQKPILNNESFWTQEGRRVWFYFNVTESHLDKISYTEGDKEVKLCASLDREGICKTKKTFGTGEHNLTIIISDKASNVIERAISFSV